MTIAGPASAPPEPLDTTQLLVCALLASRAHRAARLSWIEARFRKAFAPPPRYARKPSFLSGEDWSKWRTRPHKWIREEVGRAVTTLAGIGAVQAAFPLTRGTRVSLAPDAAHRAVFRVVTARLLHGAYATTKDLAGLAERLNVSLRTVQRWVAGESAPDAGNLGRLLHDVYGHGEKLAEWYVFSVTKTTMAAIAALEMAGVSESEAARGTEWLVGTVEPIAELVYGLVSAAGLSDSEGQRVVERALKPIQTFFQYVATKGGAR